MYLARVEASLLEPAAELTVVDIFGISRFTVEGVAPPEAQDGKSEVL